MQRVQDPLLGKVLADRFEMLDRIGEGGMGVVYRARQVSVDRIVAIKVLNAQVAQDPQWVGRFINEAKACSKLQHPNTVRLIDFGQTREGLLFMAMEFLDGMAIRTAIDRYGRMQPARVMRILGQCCQSLAEAHNFGIIHRDIKPDNLFLVTLGGQPDFVKVLDFSVAKLKQASGSAMQTQAGVVFGTPNYMSPEQGRGLPLDARSDIYALGIVAYEMLMGKPPFNSQNPMEVLAMHVRTPVPPMTGVPDAVAQVVMRALAKDPAHRQQNVEQLNQECQTVVAQMGGPGVGGMGVSAPIPSHAPHSPMQQRTMFAADAGALHRPPPAGMSPDPARTMIAGGPMGHPGMPPGMGMPHQRPMMPMPPQQMPAHTPTTPQGPHGAAQPQTVVYPGHEGMRQSGSQMAARGKKRKKKQTSTALFWALCIIAGVLIGIIAYLLVSSLAS
jgi:eukaryotic-like serine/threonine-protein kinase